MLKKLPIIIILVVIGLIMLKDNGDFKLENTNTKTNNTIETGEKKWMK